MIVGLSKLETSLMYKVIRRVNDAYSHPDSSRVPDIQLVAR